MSSSTQRGSPPAPAAPLSRTTEYVKMLIQERIPKDQDTRNHDSSVYKNFIRNAADFEDQHRSYMALGRLPSSSTQDFPADDFSQQQLAKRLTDAMLRMTDAKENCKESVARIHLLSPYEVVLKAWDLMFVMRDVQDGQLGMARWGIEWDCQHFESYMHRFDFVCLKLQQSKSLVSSLFDHDFTIRLAVNPKAEFKKMAKFHNNGERAKRLAEAQKFRSTREGNRISLPARSVLRSGFETLNPGSSTLQALPPITQPALITEFVSKAFKAGPFPISVVHKVSALNFTPTHQALSNSWPSMAWQSGLQRHKRGDKKQ